MIKKAKLSTLPRHVNYSAPGSGNLGALVSLLYLSLSLFFLLLIKITSLKCILP